MKPASYATILAVLIGSGCQQSSFVSEEVIQSTIVIALDEGAPANRGLLGSNVQWVDRGDGLITEEARPAPDMIEKVKALGPTILRYPGGSFSDHYRWKEGIGPIEKRPLNKDAIPERPQRVLLGTREFLEVCKAIGADPLITVNVVTGTAQEAADWVAVAADLSKKEGLPHVRWWEIGNEPYLKPEKRPDQALTPEEYARRAAGFIPAMKRADPRIQVGIPLRSDTLGGQPFVHFPGYTDKVLRALKRDHVDFEFVSLHNAYLPGAWGSTRTDEDYFRAAMAGACVVKQDLDATRRQLAEHFPGRVIKLALTEYNALYSIGGQPTDRYVATLAGALYVADLLQLLCREPDVLMANFWSLSGNWHFGAVAGDGRPRPAYFVVSAFNELLRGRLIDLKIQCPSSDCPAVGFVPRLSGMPLISAVGSRHDDTIRLLILNKDPRRPADAQISWPAGRTLSSCKARELWTEECFGTTDRNFGWKTKDVVQSASPLRVKLKRHSLTLLELAFQ